jgi:hypothetical protein
MRRHRREPAHSVLDRASAVLLLPWRSWPCTTGCRAGLPPRFFRLIIGGRSLFSISESARRDASGISVRRYGRRRD